MAESISITTSECRLYFFKIAEPNIPILANKYIMTGSSKNIPVKKVEVVIIDMYELMVKLFCISSVSL